MSCATCGKETGTYFSDYGINAWQCRLCKRAWCWTDSLKARAEWQYHEKFNACWECIAKLLRKLEEQRQEDKQADWWGIQSWYRAEEARRRQEAYERRREEARIAAAWEAAGEQEL